MEKLKIGTYDGNKLFTLSTAIVTSTQAIIARKRSGKSYTGDVEAEEMLKHHQQIGIIDPTGAHWGLRSSADGNSAGYAVIVFGGDHEDAPLDWRAGRAMAQAFIANGFSAIWDISNFDTEEQITFVHEFAREMLKANREAVHLFIDEADTYAPQQLESKQQKLCLGSMRRLVKQGGVRGIGVTLITQRSSDLSKSVLSQVDSVVALTVSHPPDIAPIVEWVSANVGAEQSATLKAEMPKLTVGEAFFCSRDQMRRVKVRLRETFNSGATPKPGERKIVPKVMAQIDIKKLGQQIAASVEEAKANSPEELKKKIEKLEQQVAKGGNPSMELQQHIAELEAKAERVEGLEAERDAARSAESSMLGCLSHIVPMLHQMVALGTKANTLIPTFEDAYRTGKAPTEFPAHAIPLLDVAPPARVVSGPSRELPSPFNPARSLKPSATRYDPPAASNGDRPGIKAGARRMLAAVASFYPKGSTESQVARSAGVKKTGGTFGDYKSLLKKGGYIEIRDGLWYATEEGLAASGQDRHSTPRTTAEVLAFWGPKMKGKTRDMLQFLIQSNGNWRTYEEIATHVGIEKAGGTFGDYLSLLRTMDLIITERGHARANAEMLFLAGGN